MRQHLSARTLPKPKFRYAAGVRIGSTYQLAGMIALDPVAGTLEPGGPEAEARKVFANVLGALPSSASASRTSLPLGASVEIEFTFQKE